MGKLRIVAIVDDDEAVRLANANLVRALDWPVRVFASAQEYLRSAYVGDTACLISDVSMPGMSGIELHAHLLSLGIAQPTLFVTAFRTETVEAEVLVNGTLALLEKPFDADVVAHWIELAMSKP
jgi:FixJ family two-component response regulator